MQPTATVLRLNIQSDAGLAHRSWGPGMFAQARSGSALKLHGSSSCDKRRPFQQASGRIQVLCCSLSSDRCKPRNAWTYKMGTGTHAKT